MGGRVSPALDIGGKLHHLRRQVRPTRGIILLNVDSGGKVGPAEGRHHQLEAVELVEDRSPDIKEMIEADLDASRPEGAGLLLGVWVLIRATFCGFHVSEVQAGTRSGRQVALIDEKSLRPGS